MLTRNCRASFLACCFVVSGLLIGCQPAEEGEPQTSGGNTAAPAEDEYDPHDVPITEEQKAELREQTAKFPRAIQVMIGLRDAVKTETADGIPAQPYKAHQALDKADLVLQWLPDIARTSGVAKEHWEEINSTANDIRTLFDEVHHNIDEKKDPDFGAVADDLEKKLMRLEEIAKLPVTEADTND